MSIRVDNVSKRWGKTFGLKEVGLEVREGELMALLGPSGSGKTTLLRIIGGLEAADAGGVTLDLGASMEDEEPRVGFVFQHYALFRHMTVFENVAFGLRVMPPRTRPDEKSIAARVDELLELVQLGEFAHRMPAQLSGGQRQRVALARALAVKPRVLLLDEPFGALDAQVRQELRRWLRRLHDELHCTSVFVTHDQEEALEVADRVAVLHKGRLVQVGTPEEVVDAPANAFVNEFLGDSNVLQGVVDARGAAFGPLVLEAGGLPEGTPVKAIVRTHDVKLTVRPYGTATVRRIRPLGDRVRVEVDVDGGGALVAEWPRHSSHLKGLSPGGRADVEVALARLYADDASPGLIVKSLPALLEGWVV